ncbi:phosphatidylinositol-specific phospholipase C [Chitinophaga agrisoli]|nr:phosphatidylinositol-specific phospholipase C [Chitinophaga agrisoli]
MKRQTFIVTTSCLVAMVSLFGCKSELQITRGATTETPAPTTLAAASSVSLDNWMAAIPNNYRLTQLSLPGTHNACARYEPLRGTAKCQRLTVDEQLNAGIRFLDIRCRHIDNTFSIYHGAIYQKQDLDAVLAACSTFLDKHPSECIIVSIKEEYHPANNTRSFEATFGDYAQRYAGKWYLGTTVPPLEQVRGKIVLLRRFEARRPIGIDASGWSRNSTFTINNGDTPLRVQDEFVVPSNRAKWHTSTALLTEARSQADEASLYINFTSGYRPRPALFHIPNIKKVAYAMGNRITRFFSDNPQGRFGIIVMDFVDEQKAALVITTNFHPASPAQKETKSTFVLNQAK